MMNKRSVVVSIIGRPNVGKSTVFNRLMRKSFKAMTYDQPGVTRDRHYGIATFDNVSMEEKQDVILVDTGGFYPEKVEASSRPNKKKTAEPFFHLMADHAKLAIEESDLVILVVDVREGLIPFDKTICDYIRTTKKPMWLVVNKFDSDTQWGDEVEFYQLGLKDEHFFIISAEHNRGLIDLRERLFDFSKDFETNDALDVQKGVRPKHDVVANIAIVGAPNAGKSTLLNQFVGAKRALVSSVAGTTVDPIEGYFDLYFGDDVHTLKVMEDQFRKTNTELMQELLEYAESFEEQEMLAYGEMPDQLKFERDDNEDGEIADEDIPIEQNDLFTLDDLEQSLDQVNQVEEQTDEEQTVSEFNPFRSVKLVDTAGIRKQKNVEGFIEEQSVYRSLKAITQADIVIYMVDATKGITHQDRRLCDIALEKGKSIIIVLNKADLMQDILQDKKKKREWLLDLKASIPWLSFCEMITISAKTGVHMQSLRQSLRKTIVVRSKKLTTGRLNKILSFLMDKYPIVLNKSGNTRLKVKYASMLKSTPPTILMFTNKAKGIPTNYRKYLINGLRREFGLINTPVHLIFRTTTDIQRRIRKVKQ